MKFYDCTTAPSPRRVRMLMAEKGIEIETVQVNLGEKEQLGEAFRKINPHGTVPVLVLDDGTALLDSTSISIYLDGAFPEPNLMGRNPQESAVIAMWNREMEYNGSMAVMEAFRNSSKAFQGRALASEYNYEQIPELAERGKLRVRHFFANLDKRLGESEFVAGDRFTIADITGYIAVEFSRAAKEAVPDDAANLKRWRDAIAARPSAKA